MSLDTDPKSKEYCINFVNLNDSNTLLKNHGSDDLNTNTKDNKITIKEHNYTPEEMGHILKYNSEIKELIGFVESKFAASFSSKNLSQVINMFDNLNLPLDVYKFLVTYAHSKGISNINSMLSYIEKVAVSLCEKSIKTLDDAEKYLSRTGKYSNNPPATPTSDSKGSVQKSNTKYINFDQPEWDFDEIKRLEDEFIEEDIKRIEKKNKE